MKKVYLLFLVALVGVLVACTYFIFEYAVHHSITYIWDTVFNTEDERWLVIPLCVSLTLMFFGLQHFLDKKSEAHEAHGLGNDTVVATFKNFFVILLIGFFSLLAGASLGPEAILVPASVVMGALVAKKLAKDSKQATGALSAAAIIALFAAFFHSFIIGFLSLFLVAKIAKAKINAQLLVVAAIAAGVSTLVLKAIDPTGQFFAWPDYSWKIRLIDLFISIILIFIGYGITWAIKYSHDFAEKAKKLVIKRAWWQHALLAGVGLSALYILGGPLVQFTGNESIAPLLNDASSLGVLGLAWIFIIKIAAIGWSKSLGYRGGMIFPTIFVVSIAIAVMGQFYSEINFILWLVACMAGVLMAERKAKILL
jgi:H+/Cl- antiporter ClcA